MAVRLVCREDRPERLLAELGLHNLDVVLSDAPRPPRLNVVAYNHLLGECAVLLFGAVELAERYTPGFPESLDGAPFLLPTDETALRRSLEQWLERHAIKPEVIGEFDDSSLMKSFGFESAGVFAAPAVIETELTRLAGVESHGSSESGKLILTLEAENDAGLVETMDRIQVAEGVVNVSLVYHHMEEMDDAR